MYVLFIEGWTDADGTRDTLILFDFMTLLDFSVGRLVDLLHTHVLLTTTELRSVDGDEETADTALLGMLHVSLRDFTVTVDVELDEELLAVGLCVDDFVKRT